MENQKEKFKEVMTMPDVIIFTSKENLMLVDGLHYILFTHQALRLHLIKANIYFVAFCFA